MGKKELIKKSALKKKKKTWISILSPKEFNEMEIGETLISDPQEAINKHIAVSLMAITNDIKKQSVRVVFKITEIKDNKALTEIIGYEIIDAYLKRITRRAKSKVEDSYDVITKDNIKVRIKPVIMTKNETSNSVLTSIHHKSKELLIENFKNNSYNDIVNGLITHNLQKAIRDGLKKIYPIAVSEIRYFRRL
ncbi:MAG TPA: hypothetical protein VJJ23_01400 [Candidatus Nanoarchaeia archaeon]|nr:hypothetical protein [Candidatus Nanoarchaeia archaeon]